MLLTTVVAAAPDLREPVPAASLWPLITAIAVGIVFVASIFSPWALAVGVVPMRYRRDRLVLAEGPQAPSRAGDLMILEPRFTGDVADLPTHKFGPSSLTWWGIIGFMVIEGGFFALAFAAYFFLMGHEQGWPPEGRRPADLLAGTLFTIVILASEFINTKIKKAANAGDVPAIRRLILIMIAIGAVLLVIRGFEFNSLNCRWTDDAYSSIIWALLVLHTTHLLTDWGDTVVLRRADVHARRATRGDGGSMSTRTRSTGATSGCCGSRST